MRKKKPAIQQQGQWLTLSEANAASEQVTPEALEQFWHNACSTCHVFEFRMQAARAADDDARVKQLQSDEQFIKAKKRAAYFEKELAKFPNHKPAPLNTKEVERQLVVTDYLSAKRLKRDAEIMAQAARALDDETEKKMALQDMQRALKYIRYLEPKFKKIERQMNKAASR